jgi:hypothetical protein
MRLPQDSLLRLGTGLTVSWLLLAIGFVLAKAGWSLAAMLPGLLRQQAGTVGDFAAGVTAPLAFLWLVLGFEQQRRNSASSAKDVHIDRSILLMNASLAQLHELAH